MKVLKVDSTRSYIKNNNKQVTFYKDEFKLF